MFYTTNPIQTGLGLNLDSHGDMLGSNSLSHGMAARLLEHMKRSVSSFGWNLNLALCEGEVIMLTIVMQPSVKDK